MRQKIKLLSILFATLFLGLFYTRTASAVGGTAIVSGKVTDASNNPLANITITVTNGQHVSTTTDANGNYSINVNACVVNGGVIATPPYSSGLQSAISTGNGFCSNYNGSTFNTVVNFTLEPFTTATFQPVTGSWTLVGLGDQTVSSLAVDPTNSSILYAAASLGIFKSTNGGETWSAINNGLPIGVSFTNALVIDPTNPNVVYAGTYNGIFKSTDAGASWTNISSLYSITTVFNIAIDPTNPSTVYIAGGNGVWKSTDSGASWTQTPLPYGNSARVVIDPTNPNNIYALANGNSILKSTDGASSWSVVLSPSGSSLDTLTIDPFNTNILYAGTLNSRSTSSGEYKSIDGGATWTWLNGSPAALPNTLITDPARANTVYAGDYTTSRQSTDAGSSWSDISTGFNHYGYNFLVRPSSAPNALYAGSNTGGVYVYGLPSTNLAPNVNSFQGATINEGDTYSSTGSFTDSDSTSWTATVDFGDGGGAHALTLNSDKSFSLSHVYNNEGTYTVTVAVTDNQGATGTGTATVTVNNAPFTIGAVSTSNSVVQVNNQITASASYTDPGVLDSHTASWNWGDGNTATGTVTESNGSGSVQDTHTYTAAGVYTITLTVTDDDGVSNSQQFQYESVYNPTAQGLFSGAHLFSSPAGAYPQNSSLTGNVTFGLSYKYQGTMPVGDRQFTMNFSAAPLLFNATTVSSLVIANNVATLTGTGTINGGSATYNFLVVGANGGIIRVQITDPANNNAVIYDTQPGDPATATPTTSVTGNVIAHN